MRIRRKVWESAAVPSLKSRRRIKGGGLRLPRYYPKQMASPPTSAFSSNSVKPWNTRPSNFSTSLSVMRRDAFRFPSLSFNFARRANYNTCLSFSTDACGTVSVFISYCVKIQFPRVILSFVFVLKCHFVINAPRAHCFRQVFSAQFPLLL